MIKKRNTSTRAFYSQCQKQAVRELLHIRELPMILLKGALCSTLATCAVVGAIFLGLYAYADLTKVLGTVNGVPPDMLLAAFGSASSWFTREVPLYVALTTPFYGVILQLRLKTDKLLLKPRISTT